MPSIELISITLEFVGTIFVAYAALRVHHRVLGEHKIDEKVFKTMKREQFIGWTGVGMVVAGYFLALILV